MTNLTPQASSTRGRIRAPRGDTLSCKGWQQEGTLRMLMNSLDSDLAEPSDTLIGAARSARDWASYDELIAALHGLEDDDTLLVQSGEPMGVFRTHEEAPRVLIAGANFAGSPSGENSSPKKPAEPEYTGRTIFGEMLDHVSAGSWMYTGTQGALHGTYQIFAAAAQKHFGGTLGGKLVVAGGMGRGGGAQPLAAALNGAAFLGIEADPERIKRRLKGGYCDVMVNDLDESLRILKNAVRKREPASVGLVGNCADIFPALVERGVVPDLLTDQTSAQDSLHGYIPSGLDVGAAAQLGSRDPEEYRRRAADSIAVQARGMLGLQKLGAIILERNSVSEFLRPFSAEGRAPLLCVALSGEASDIYRADELLLGLPQRDKILARWIRLIGKRIRFEGLPARTCWLSDDKAIQFGLALNGLVTRGEVKAPMLIGRGHFSGPAYTGVATEGIDDRPNPAVRQPLLGALLDTASGASWVSIRTGGGESGWQHSEYAMVADGTPEMGDRIENVLVNNSNSDVAPSRAGEMGTSSV